MLHLELTGGSWYTPGGLRRVVDAVADRARERGARVLTGTRVVEVLVDGGRAAGVRLADGRRVAADVVVVNADAAALYGVRTPARPRGPAPASSTPERPRGPGGAGGHRSVAERVRAAAGPARAHAGPRPPHGAVPASGRRGLRRRVRRGLRLRTTTRAAERRPGAGGLRERPGRPGAAP
ncbi:MAG: FAD-dependent oxidoreductase [Quadrisphaera sp.]